MKKAKGFTLIELLVVIAIIALLLAILVPALNRVKVQATGIVCLSHLDGLTMAWVLYAEDNDTKVVGPTPYGPDAYTNERVPPTPTGALRRVWNFVGSPHDQNGSGRNDVLEDELRGFRTGGLWGYAETEKIYHCLSDKRYLKPPTGDGSGSWGLKGGYRSYSLGAVWNCYTPGWNTDENMVVVYSTSEIVSPAYKMVFLEENDGYGYNGNTFNFFLNTRAYWGDPFSVSHGNRSTFGFADGHAEMHEWKDQSTRDMAEENIKLKYLYAGEHEDIDWFRQHYVPGRMPAALRNI
ncbi:MAG: prepilin-type N-terminal cleavage/methylation domain-containing protein [Planctomycetes bacterium]|nr:prepilin-type N-terminal cleavage/methylation domain-containing protein [Planctomycetota bacterium]